MKWIISLILSVVFWSFCDVLLKRSTKQFKGKDVIIKYGIVNGIIYFILAMYILLCRDEEISLITSACKFWPVTIFGIIYCVVNTIHYNSYRYNDVSTSSVISNTSQTIGIIILIIVYIAMGRITSIWDIIDIYKIIGIILMLIGIFLIATTKKGFIFKKKNKIGYPLMYASMDGIKIIISGLAVNRAFGFGMPEMDIPIIYGILYGIGALVLEIIYLVKNKKLYQPINKYSVDIIFGSACDIIALLFYTIALSIDSIFTETLIMLYPVLVIFISRIYLREHLKKREYTSLVLILISTILIIISQFI